jgi:hypothetical protein
MGMKLPFDKTERRLEREKLIDREITAVIGWVLRRVKWTFHEGSVGKRVTSDK